MYFLSFFLFLGFVFFSYLVSQEQFSQFDFDTTVRIQNKIPPDFIGPFSVLSLLGTLEITGLIWLVIFVLALVRRAWKFSFMLLLLPISQVVELYGKVFLLHASPPFMFFKTKLPFYFPSGYVHTDYSYPSGHSIRTTFLIVLALFFVFSRFSGTLRWLLSVALVVMLSAMLLSRVYLGEHWTTDVLGGAALGLSFGIAAGLTIRRLQPSRQQRESRAKPAVS